MEGTKILGVDIGHGETAAVCMEVETKKITRLNLEDGQVKVIPTLVGFRRDGGAVIGNAAGKGSDIEEVVAYFKKAPAHFSDVVRRRPRREYMELFVRRLVEQIFEYNRDVLTPAERDSIQLIVGCPSSREWTGEEARKSYEDLLRAASGIENTAVVPESRAALFSTFTDQGMRGTSAENGVLVFDFGSSTADCTYMCMGKMLLEYSWKLGASEIEELMIDELQRVMEESARKQGVRATFPNRDGILFSLRVDKKERYYSRMLLEDESTFMRRAVVLDDKGAPVLDGAGKPRKLKVEIEVDDGLMDRLVRTAQFRLSRGREEEKVSDSWYGHCRSFLEEARAVLTRKQLPCQTVMLTGGASKMDFVAGLCQEVFPEIPLIRADEPSFSVALGLAWTGMVDNQIEQSRKVALAKAKGDRRCGKTALWNDIAGRYRDPLYGGFRREVEAWAAAPEERSIQQLIEGFQKWYESEEVQPMLHDQLYQALESWLEGCGEAVQQAVNEQSVEIFKQSMAVELKLQEDFVSQFIQLELDTGKMIGKVDLGGMFTKVALASGMVVLSGILFAIFGPLALPVIALLMAIGLGSSGSDEKLKKPLNQKQRGDASAKLLRDSSTKNKIQSEVRTALSETLGPKLDEALEHMTDRAMDILALRWFAETQYL